MAKKRKMSAKQRKYFGGGSKRKIKKASASKSAGKSAPKKKKSSMFNGLFPMNTEEHIISFSAGAITAPINDLMKPIQTKYLGWAGQYSDEASLMLAGVIGHKFGGKIHPQVKKISSELYRVGVISLGQQTGSGIAQSVVDRIKGVTGGNSTQNGVVVIG